MVGAEDAQGNGLLQGAIPKGCLVSGPLPPRWISGQSGGDVRSGSAEGDARTGRIHASSSENPRESRARIRFEAATGGARSTHRVSKDSLERAITKTVRLTPLPSNGRGELP